MAILRDTNVQINIYLVGTVPYSIYDEINIPSILDDNIPILVLLARCITNL